MPAIRLASSVDDASFIDTAKSDRRRRPYLSRSRPVLRSVALSVVAAALGWTVYYDLLAHHSLPVPPLGPARAVIASRAKELFPPDGTMVADFQPSDASGAGLTLQMPADDLGLLFVVVFENWQTGARTAHAFLRANTVATFLVIETIGPVAISDEERVPRRLIWGSDTRFPTAEVPTALFKMLVPERG